MPVVFFRCIDVKRYSLTGKCMNILVGHWQASGKFKGGPHSKFTLLPSTFRVGQKVGCHLCCFSLPQEIAECAGVFPWKRDGKNPMVKWISRLLSLHAVVRSAHDACCTLTSEYVTNSECWSPCSNVATEGWMGLVRKNEGFSSKDFYPPKKREDWKMQMKWTPFFFGIEWYWNLDPSFWSESQRHTMILTELPSWFFSTHLLNNKKHRRFFLLVPKNCWPKTAGPQNGWGYSLVNGRCTCEGDSLHDGLSSVCSYDASHVCSSDSSTGSTSTTLMGPVGEWVATGQCLSDIPDFWMSCGYVFQLQCASKTSYPVRGAIFWAPNPANTCSLPSTCNDVGDFLCCPEESWEPCLLYDWTAVGVVFLVILLLLMLLGGNRSVFLVSYLPILFFLVTPFIPWDFFRDKWMTFCSFPQWRPLSPTKKPSRTKTCIRKFLFLLASFWRCVLIKFFKLRCCCVACCYCYKCCCFSESGAKRRKFTNLAPSQPELVGVVVGQGKGTDTEWSQEIPVFPKKKIRQSSVGDPPNWNMFLSRFTSPKFNTASEKMMVGRC